jgi:uncharacterized cupredoxin-like copper-binding protein
MMRGTTSRRLVIAVTSLALVMAACGDDDDETTAATDDTAAEYCAIASELDEQEDFPSKEQLESLAAAAPDEISEDVDAVVPGFIEGIEAGDPFAAFEAPGVEEHMDAIEAFEAEACGIGDDDEEEDEPEQDAAVTQPDPAAAQIAVTATEYEFTFSAEPVAGPTQFTMTNEGEERHVMVLFRLAEGATMDEVMESEGDEGIDGPELESETAAAGETAVLTTDLEAGTYGMICFLPSPDGRPHLMQGMTKEFVVS